MVQVFKATTMSSSASHDPPPVGMSLPNWRPVAVPPREPRRGRYMTLEPLDASRHGASLASLFAAEDPATWTYMGYGPFESPATCLAWLRTIDHGDDPIFLAVLDSRAREPLGVLSWNRIDPANGVIEIAHVVFSSRLKRTRVASEAVIEMIRWAWELGYRRIEWKCDALNGPSRQAATRFGFVYEGTFRQAVVVKQRNRDTAWFSIIDTQRPRLEKAYEAWLADSNFDEAGRQRSKLNEGGRHEE